MCRLIVALLVLSVFTVPVTVLAQESAEGIIEGQVINETENGGSVSGLDVSLFSYVDDMLGETKTTKTDGTGRFYFTNLATEHDYLTSVNYMEVDYYLPTNFGEGEIKKTLEVPVCDATTSDEVIRVALAHAIIYVEEENIAVTEVLWLVNDGDHTFVGTEETTVEGKQGTLVFTLPEGATDFQTSPELMQEYLFLGNNRVADNLAFPPGERQVVYSYRLARPDSDEFVIPLRIYYPTDVLEVMVEGEDIEVSSPQLTPAEPVDTEAEERFIHFSGAELSRDDTINVHLYGLSGGSNVAAIVFWSLAAVVMVGIIYLIVRRRGLLSGASGK